jgi:DNA-binding response OmpR family regulator
MKKPRILIVEDEAVTASDLKRQLVAENYEVAGSAATAEEAVRLVGELAPDLVLMDITLAGGLDGITAALAVRGTYEVPVVFLTAHADDATIRRATLAGPFGYVLKPFQGAELKAAIEVALHKHRTETELKKQGGAE